MTATRQNPASEAGPIPRPGIMDIAPYVPGRTRADGALRVIKLSSNEAALGASPRAIAAYRSVADGMHRYPDGDAVGLRRAIAERFGLAIDHLICGAGSDEVLTLLTQCFVGPGDDVVMSRHGFLVYEIATRAAGGNIIKAPESDLRCDIDAMIAAITPKTKIVFVANPNNPTGTYLTQVEMRRLHSALPPHVLLVIDAAYAEFVRRNDYDAGIELASGSRNVVMTRTFSKVFGLAGLRIGWGYGPKSIIDTLNRVRGPFNASIPAQAAAIAALEDRDFLEAAVAHNLTWVEWVTAEIRALGLEVTPSVGNFVLVRFPDRPGLTARECEVKLAERGILVRAVAAYGLGDYLRMSIGREEENRALVDALAQIMGSARG